MSADTQLHNLSDAQRRLVEGRLHSFRQSWDDKRMAAEMRSLPPAGDPVRAALVLGLAEEDLRQRWRHGQRATVEAYLKACPELGPAATAPVALILAEFQARQEARAPASVDEFAGRFPGRAAELRQRLEGTFVATPGTSPGLDSATSPGLPAPSVSGQQPPPEQFGRYRIVRLLGRGGMGAVYLAQDTQLDRRVALKIPSFGPDDGPEARERFLREARSAATLDHPNICPVHDMGEVNGSPYLTMAFVEGKPLSELVARGPLPAPQAAHLVRKLALALAEAHARKIIHRDLKPSNIMVNTRGEPVLMDFGLARRTNRDDERLTQSGTVLGTPAYMSPEQVEGDVEAHGPQTDVYSLGAVLYEMLTGQPPFSGVITKVLVQVLRDEPTPPTRLRPDLDPALEAICLKAMAKKPAARYAGMKEFAAALTAFLKGQTAARASSAEVVVVEEASPRETTVRKARDEETLQPRGPRAEGRGEKTIRPQARPDRDEDDDRDGPAHRPTRKVPRRHRERPGPSAGVWLAAGGGLLALLLVIGFGVWAVKRVSSKPDAPAPATSPSPVAAQQPAALPQPQPPPPRPQGPRLPRGWKRYEPQGGGFRISFPGQPASQKIPLQGANLTPMIQYSIQEGDTWYSAAYADLIGRVWTDKELVSWLDNTAISLMKASVSPTLVRKRSITLGDRPGVEVLYDAGPPAQRQRWLYRSYVSGTRMFALLARAPLADFPIERIEAFFDTFELLP